MRTVLCVVQRKKDSAGVSQHDLRCPIASVSNRCDSSNRTTQSQLGFWVSTWDRYLEYTQGVVSWSIKGRQANQNREKVMSFGDVTQSGCRFCGTVLQHTFVDLGMSPLAESWLKPSQLNQMEPFYPLHVYVCECCFLVQLEQYESPENIFSDYAYFSSYSDSWLKHAEHYCDKMLTRLGLNAESFVVEVASNDGYLLQYFVQRDVPVLGIEPAVNVARVAVEKGVPTLVRFFGTQLAKALAAEGRCADLVLGNNVLAQVPDLNDFVEGLKVLLKPEGVLTLEFPHLLRLIENHEFDTIYHEHFSYFSLLTT